MRSSHQVVPALPVLGRRHDRAVLEHRLRRVAGQVVRHERDLDDRVEPEAPDVVVDPVHSREVVDRVAVHLAVDREVVAEDPVRTHGPHPELLVRGEQGRGQLLADHPAAGGVGGDRVREVLGADHRPPRPRQLDRRTGRVDHQVDRSDRLGRRCGRHAVGGVALDRDVRQGADGVPAFLPRRARGVDVGRVRDGQHVLATVVERLQLAVDGVGDVDLVADRAGDGVPGERHLGAPRGRPEAGGRRQPRRGARWWPRRCGGRCAAPSRCVRRSPCHSPRGAVENCSICISGFRDFSTGPRDT